ncbi:MAG: STAS domain-containing protein [Clostridia bacterium]|nr:STAS domain-containing protein [Clostridia bacterium]
MNVTFQENFNELEVKLHGEIDHHCARGLSDSIDFKIKRHRPSLLILDFGGVSFMDSSGLAVVMGRRKLMQSMDGKVELRHLCGSPKKIFDMAGIANYVIIKEEKYESE